MTSLKFTSPIEATKKKTRINEREEKLIYAMINIFKVAAISSCLFISDTKGPYNSIDECLNRVEKILEDANRVLSGEWYSTYFYCRSEHGIKYKSRIDPKNNI